MVLAVLMKYLRYLRAKKGEKRGGEAEHEKPESGCIWYHINVHAYIIYIVLVLFEK